MEINRALTECIETCPFSFDFYPESNNIQLMISLKMLFLKAVVAPQEGLGGLPPPPLFAEIF